ncbi:Lrp/AsnC family transcriptional regulator [Salinibacter sp.]|uniref:HVO_A0114 family putative DNA-binding protein n=1 Tax=Salinibacter sp. TaxID=2065818 RepID=UPI0021E715B2|nr:Lrp/AsnC family transcriptional regulator [Salinibacter sp.]
MSSPDLSDTEADVLRAVQSEATADLYDLARAVGAGPRAVQNAVRRLARYDLVHASGRHVRCTSTGDQWVRAHS